MSFEAVGWAINVKTKSPQSKLLLMILSSMADEHGKCFPSHQYLADKARMSKRSVINHLKVLSETGYLFTERRFNTKGKTSNLYTICFQPYILMLERNKIVQELHMGSAGDALTPSAGAAHESITLSNLSIKQNGQNEFDRWWAEYPRKVKKKETLKVWKQIKPDADTLIADTINRNKNDSQWKGGYVPHPTTYLRGERWNDELEHGQSEGTLSPADEYAARVSREDEIISKLNGDHVADHGEIVSPAVDEKQRRDWQSGIPRLDGGA